MLAGVVNSSSNTEPVRPAVSAYSLRGASDAYVQLEPDVVLPQQIAGSPVTARSGEFGLLWAVFTDGIQTYCREILRGSTAGLEYREVHRWIFRPNSDGITAFPNLCEIFGIDARRMRRALIRFREYPSEGILNLMTSEGRLGAAEAACPSKPLRETG